VKKILGPILMLFMVAPVRAGEPNPVVIQSPSSEAVVHLEGFCQSPCYAKWAEIDWLNETTDKVLVVTDVIFSNGGNGVQRLRASVSIWNPPYDYNNDETEARVSNLLVYVPANDVRSLSLQTGLRVNPGQSLAIPLFEGAGTGHVTVMGRLEDL